MCENYRSLCWVYVSASALIVAVSTLTTATGTVAAAVVVIVICQALFSLNAATPFHMGCLQLSNTIKCTKCICNE